MTAKMTEDEADAKILSESVYIGDGVYMHRDDVSTTLFTTVGAGIITNRVHLDADTLANFLRVLRRQGYDFKRNVRVVV